MKRVGDSNFSKWGSAVVTNPVRLRAVWMFLFLVWVLTSATMAFANEPLRLLRVTPSGTDVPAERQIVFQFDRAVVPLGRMARNADEIPISISPDPDCEWRWIDPTALACQLGDKNPLTKATRYRARFSSGLQGIDGGVLVPPADHVFVTERPSIRYQWFQTWTGPGEPVIRFTFNQGVEGKSLRRKVSFGLPKGQRVPVDVEKAEQGANTWFVRPRKPLPLDTPVTLRVSPGIRSTEGPLASVDDKVLSTFKTFGTHRFLGVRCQDLQGNEILLKASLSDERRCNPLAGVALAFSSPVRGVDLGAGLKVAPDLAGGRAGFDPWENGSTYSRLSTAPRSDERYDVYLPIVLQAWQPYELTAAANAVRDEFGRPLDQDLSFQFATDHRAPRLHLGHSVSVLEEQVPTHLPAIVTNLDEIQVSYTRMTPDGTERDTRTIPAPKVEDVATRIPLPVREWLGGASGAVLGTMDPRPDPNHRVDWFFSEVTPYQVHAKIGHYSSLIWVTDMATGKPVKGASVKIYADSFDHLRDDRPALAEAKTNRKGIAVFSGIETLDPDRENLDWWQRREETHLFVRVDTADAMALLPLAGDFRLDARGPNRSWISTAEQKKNGHLKAWGATAQGIYRLGDEVEFKLWVRNEGNERLEPAPAKTYALTVFDPTDKKIHEVDDIELNEYGSLIGAFTVPKGGAVGWYRFELQAKYAGRTLYPLQVLVADFTPAPFRVQTELEGELFAAGDLLKVSSSARLHGGGPYRDAESRVVARLRATPVRVQDAAAKGFQFTPPSGQVQMVHRSDEALDERGDRQTEFSLPASSIVHGSLDVESAVRDDRGKYVAGRKQARYVGRDRFVGLMQRDWVLQSGEASEIRVVVIDENGKIRAGTDIDIQIERRVTKAAQVKEAGNAYVKRFTHSWEAVSSCSLTSGNEPTECAFTPAGPGAHRFLAKISDTQGRESTSNLQRWAMGKGHTVWEEPPGHHLDVLPEKEVLQVGDKARYLVRNPYPGATALVTIERFGVIKSWLETLEESSEIIEFEVEPDFLPGFYLSVVVTSPRVAAPNEEQLKGSIDLGKPGFRMGYAKTTVRDPHKELRITVEPERESYKPREKVVVDLHASTHKSWRADAELAVAVLDEAVFDLLAKGRAAYDPYQGFYNLEGLDLWNFNLLKQLIGVQSFGSKGASPGGGGGGDAGLRSKFEFVSYWNPSVRLDWRGRAQVEFEVPDNLTGWRVLVFGATPGDRMGLGDATFVVNQPTEIRPALPNQVVEGDQFDARFTVMNRTDQARTLEVELAVSGDVEGEPRRRLKVDVEPYKSQAVSLPVVAARTGQIQIDVRAGDDQDRDRTRVSLPIGRRSSLDVAASYGSTEDEQVSEAIRFPDEIRTDIGKLSVIASPTAIGNLDGAFRFMKDYPYACWEQTLSKGVMAAHYADLKPWLSDEITWPGSEALPKRTLDRAGNFQAPNGGMAYWVPSNDRTSPYLSAYTALAFQWFRSEGHAIPKGVEERLHGYLLGILRRNDLPDFYSKGMASTVRAVALAALAPAGEIDLADLERHRSHLKEMDLFGKAWFLHAAGDTPGSEAIQREARDAILAHGSQTAGKLVYSERRDDGFARMLSSSLRTQCSILSAFSSLEPELREALGGAAPKLVRTITQTRGNRDHWENTQENLFCTRALVDYAKAYEKDEPNFEVKASLDGNTFGEARFENRRAEPIEFSRGIEPGDPGTDATMDLRRTGIGRLYYATRLFFAKKKLSTESVNSGIDVRREYSVQRDGKWQKLEAPYRIEAGELVRVDLFVALPAARNFVVVHDPVPGGLEPVNRQLATASTVDADEAIDNFPPDSYYFAYDDWRSFNWTRWSFYHRELRHDSARFYSDYLPGGRYHLSYVAQAIASGEFTVLPLRAEEMYDPDVYGRGLPALLSVGKDLQ